VRLVLLKERRLRGLKVSFQSLNLHIEESRGYL
jgi:hypothetical protein